MNKFNLCRSYTVPTIKMLLPFLFVAALEIPIHNTCIEMSEIFHLCSRHAKPYIRKSGKLANKEIFINCYKYNIHKLNQNCKYKNNKSFKYKYIKMNVYDNDKQLQIINTTLIQFHLSIHKRLADFKLGSSDDGLVMFFIEYAIGCILVCHLGLCPSLPSTAMYFKLITIHPIFLFSSSVVLITIWNKISKLFNKKQ